MNLADLKREWIEARRQKSKAAIYSLLLPLSPGHTGLALASGALDGRLILADGRPVVIKGVASKSEYEKSSEPGDKKGTRTAVIGEKSVFKIKVLDESGKITTYT